MNERLHEPENHNTLLDGLIEISQPAPLSLWPETLSWGLLVFAVLLVVVMLGVRRLQSWRRTAYRRKALLRIREMARDPALVSVGDLPSVMRCCANQAYPRLPAAELHGNAWLEFLDQHCADSSFVANGSLLNAIAYQPETRWRTDRGELVSLLEQCSLWVRSHQDARDD